MTITGGLFYSNSVGFGSGGALFNGGLAPIEGSDVDEIWQKQKGPG